MKTTPDYTAVTELTLYAENIRRIYDNSTTPIIKSFHKKYVKGIFDKEKAVKAFEYVTEYAAKEYCKEFSEP